MDEALGKLQAWTQYQVKEGFDTREEIIEQAGLYAEETLERADLLRHVERLTDELMQAHRREQAQWATPTDCDRLDQAFAELERRGVVARQNFTCCQTCGLAEIGDEIEEVEKEREVEGYVFYHMQDTESVLEHGGFCLAYGAVDGSQDGTAEVGHRAVEELVRAGLKVEWDGSVATRICVTDFDWKRRRAL